MSVRRTSLALAAAAFGVGGSIVLLSGPAGAESSYDALARTETFTLNIANSSIPTGIDIEGGGPQAAVRQDSIGISDASAQLPYAGDTVPGVPGIGAGLFGFTAPPYPFIAASNSGSAPQTVSYPGVTLQAESGDFTTQASATAGQAGSGATASARVDESRLGDVVSTASTGADSVKLGPYATLSDVRSLATVKADGSSGKLTRTTTSSIGRISVPGLKFTVPKQSPGQVPIPVPIPGVPNQAPFEVPPFPFPGGGMTFQDPDLGIQDGFFTVTVPTDGTRQRYAIPAGPVLDALAAQGITLRFQAPQQTRTGVIAGAYVFSYVIPAPPPNGFYNGPTTVTQSTAYALASVNLAPVNAAVATDVPVAGTDGASDGASDVQVGVDAVAGALPTTTIPAVPAAPAAQVPTELIAAGPQPSITLAGVKVGLGIDNLYLVVAGLALAGLAAATALRLLGVRSWNS